MYGISSTDEVLCLVNKYEAAKRAELLEKIFSQTLNDTIEIENSRLSRAALELMRFDNFTIGNDGLILVVLENTWSEYCPAGRIWQKIQRTRDKIRKYIDRGLFAAKAVGKDSWGFFVTNEEMLRHPEVSLEKIDDPRLIMAHHWNELHWLYNELKNKGWEVDMITEKIWNDATLKGRGMNICKR